MSTSFQTKPDNQVYLPCQVCSASSKPLFFFYGSNCTSILKESPLDLQWSHTPTCCRLMSPTYLCTKSNSKLRRQASPSPLFFVCPLLSQLLSFLLRNSFLTWPPVWLLSNVSNIIRKSSRKEEHLTVDSPDTDQCKLLLRRDEKMYTGIKNDENKTKKNGMAS